jgi:hypothetical protein
MRLLRPLVPVLLTLCVAATCHGAAAGRINEVPDEIVAEEKAYADKMEDAAEYHKNRVTAPKEQFDDARAEYFLERARRRLLTGSEIRARWWAEDGIDEVPYSSRIGDLIRMGLEGAAVQGSTSKVWDKLVLLWLWVPDYPGMGEAMERALGVAEDHQDFTKAVNLAADDPSKVISVDGRSFFNDTGTLRLFRFLALHGDKQTVAPRAALGSARSFLLSGSKDDLFEARRAYEKFLEDFPSTELTFNALCEYALSYLVAYKGSEYDIGTLVYANAIIDQAEIEARGDKERQSTVQSYRRRIKGWTQERDLSVARWYRNRGTPWALQWLKMPTGLEQWDAGARLYYDEVVKRDATSNQGRAASGERQDLPAAQSVLAPAAGAK